MKYIYHPKGVCSKKITFEIVNDCIVDLEISGGCPGNSIGVKELCKGRNIDDIIQRLDGIPCGYKSTSCPDQIAKALKEFKKET